MSCRTLGEVRIGKGDGERSGSCPFLYKNVSIGKLKCFNWDFRIRLQWCWGGCAEQSPSASGEQICFFSLDGQTSIGIPSNIHTFPIPSLSSTQGEYNQRTYFVRTVHTGIQPPGPRCNWWCCRWEDSRTGKSGGCPRI